jgi:SNF2 family DNA or RNA helicase/uncharacterized Zn finger protein
MAREKFGNTWWGQQWLLALTKIDYSNRIPRGQRYARNGSVQSIKFFEAAANATVAGSRPRPYNVKLSMGEISNSQMSDILAAAKNYPTVIVKLLNGKMDTKLIEIMQEVGLKLFPKEAKDMLMSCSCPDWAVPCKHIAAVLYVICREIDNDPFSLFKFRGIDLQAELAKNDLHIHKISDAKIPTLKEFYKKYKYKSSKKETIFSLDLTLLKNRLSQLGKLLSDQPAFYPTGEFKLKYLTILKKKGGKLSPVLNGTKELRTILSDENKNQLSYGNSCSLSIINNQLEIEGASLSELWELDPKSLSLHHISVKKIASLLKISLHLITNGLVTPKLFEDKGSYSILWTPCLLDDTTAIMMETIEGEVPVLHKRKTLNTYMATCFLLTHLISKIEVTGDQNDPYLELFFIHKSIVFENPFEAAYPGAIYQWLRLYNLDLGNYFPVLKVEEKSSKKFEVHIEIGDSNKPLDTPVAFNNFVKNTDNNTALFDVYKDLDLLSSYIRYIDNYINTKGEKAIVYNDQTIVEFLFDVKPILFLLNIKVALPKSLKNILKPKVSAMVERSSSNESTGLLSLGDMLQFDWKISVGKDFLDDKHFNKLIKSAGKLIRFKSAYIYADEEDLNRLEKQIQKHVDIRNIDKLRIILSEEYEGTPIHISKEVKALIHQLTDTDLLSVPVDIKAKLRPYQHRGYSWLVKNSMIGVGSIIADDMGLGKTLQVISWISHVVEQKKLGEKKILIIVPTSLVPNWESEFEKFAPYISVYTHYGPQRKINKIGAEDVILTTYGVVRSDVTKLNKLKWAATIIDEAQNIKNPTSKQTKAVKSIKADHYIAMSGTPVENGLMDYWSIMDYTNKGLLYNKTQFKKQFVTPIVKYSDQKVLERFGKITAPFLLRRMKTDKTIISDLPDKIVQDILVPLSLEQSALYQKVIDEAMELIGKVDTSDSKGLFKRQGLVLQMILALKQICNHPAQWLKDGNKDIALSGKLIQLIERLETIFSTGDKVIIFTQFKEMGDILYEAIYNTYQIKALWLHGGVTMAKRKVMVQEFQNEVHQKVMILSLKAGGTGLNLTSANHVIHYDLWWNPAVEAQATDRAFRIGQKKNVFVHRMITQNTFEEKINELILSKMKLANMTVSSGESWIGKLSDAELAETFG